MNASALGIFQRLFTPTPTFQPAASVSGLVRGWLVVAGVIAFTTLSVTFVDDTTSSVDRAFALLLIAAQLSSPAGWIYYLWFAAGPVAALAFSEYRRAVLPRSGAVRWMTAFALVGFFTPITVPYSSQRTVLATLTAGSVYFWATLALWTCLIVDFAYSDHRKEYQAS
jgi:hypothetical protein